MVSIPTGAQGVRVVGTRVHETVFARVLGVNELSVHTDATAVSGPTEPCAEGGCVRVTARDGSRPPSSHVTGRTSRWQPRTPGSALLADRSTSSPCAGTIPVASAGSTGRRRQAGRTELAGQICEPDPPDLFFPDWYYVTSAGNVNSGPVQTCFEQWIGSVILIPLFEDTCRTDPGDVDECTDPAPIGGVNQWYYFPQGAAILLTGVYIQGNNSDVCDTGNGATSCLTGTFVDTSIEGDPGSGSPATIR